MTGKVLQKNEVILNDVRYKIDGPVYKQLLSRWPGRVLTGSPEYDNEQWLSAWNIKDQRGGLGIDEMDESVHADRFWWSTCETAFTGHTTLPGLATATNADKLITPTGHTDETTAWGNETNAYDGDTSTYAQGGASSNGWTGWLDFNISSTDDIRGFALFFNAEDELDLSDLEISAYYASAWHEVDNEPSIAFGKFIFGTFNTTVDAVTSVRVRFFNDDEADTKYVRIHEVRIIQSSAAPGATRAWANYNSCLYNAIGDTVQKYDTTDLRFEIVYIPVLGVNINGLVPSVGNNLYVILDDSNNYFMMTTAEAFTQKDQAGEKGIHHNNCLWIMDSAGAIVYSADPNAADPTWTGDGTLANEGVADGEVNRIYLDRNADGDMIIYAATRVGLYAHSLGNAKFVATELTLPNHTNSGKGACKWRDGSFISAGLDVHKYVVGSTATIQLVGLSRDDGLPSEYNGEITYFIPGYNDLFALVDASQVSGTGKSGVYAYDDSAWRNIWLSASNDGAMTSGIVSAVGAYQLWWDDSSAIYRMPIQRGIRNPKKLTTFTYGAAGSHITGWFDAGTSVFTKTAKKLKLYVKGVTTTETITVKYRTNRTNTDIDTGWTTAVTLDTTGENGEITYNFQTASVNKGLVFNSIQFRFDLARGSTTTTSPDIQAITFSYKKNINQVWGFGFTVIGDEAFSQSAKQIETALETAAESTTLVNFLFRSDNSNELHYVAVDSLRGETETGDYWEGRYQVSVIEP